MRFVPALLFIALLLAAGCSSQQHVVTKQRRTIDSLYVVDRATRAELYALQDSILFFQDIDSGRYFRERRQLQDRINRLEFLVAERADSVCQNESAATVLVEDLFEPASAALTDAGAERLAALAEQLAVDYPGRHFRVEGHSDNVPVGASLQERYPSNWELSAARATAVVRHLIDAHGLDAARLEAAAFGDTRPVGPNNTAAGRRQNRRIRVVVLPE